MKNKVTLKKHLLLVAIVIGVLLTLTASLEWMEFRQYTKVYNEKIEEMLQVIQASYPDVTEGELIQILNGKEVSQKKQSILERYGIDLKKDSAILENERQFYISVVLLLFTIIVLVSVICMIFLHYNGKKDEELKEITNCIERINQRNYQLDLDSISEDELSILKEEVYKTMVMLKEIAEHSKKDKENLKKSLSDISHQLKTPLTSILIILENLMDDPNMDRDVQLDFLKDIKREISNIHFLVQALLKMSKLDSDTVVFFRKETSVKELLDRVVEHVALLCDLKNITIVREGLDSGTILCDARWQEEALTNILKNCAEYSEEGGEIQIQCKENGVYTMISIRDYGIGIDEDDQKHIFERFYKGKNATTESVGIGLALAKTIIKSDNGSISVENAQPGTRFIVKYYK